MLVDSIIQESQYFKYYYVSIISYDTHQKIAQINRYGQETNRPYRLLQRIEFGNPASGINQKENDKITFSLFPNPSSDKVYLQSYLPIQSVQILDINAKVVLTAIAENVSQLEIGNLPSGIYLIEASSKNGKAYKRFVKSN